MPPKDHFSILGLGFGGAPEPEKLCFFGHETIFFAKITKIIDFGMILGGHGDHKGSLAISSNLAHFVDDDMKKLMKNDQTISRSGEKPFFYVKSPHKPYKVIWNTLGLLTRWKRPTGSIFSSLIFTLKWIWPTVPGSAIFFFRRRLLGRSARYLSILYSPR